LSKGPYPIFIHHHLRRAARIVFTHELLGMKAWTLCESLSLLNNSIGLSKDTVGNEPHLAFGIASFLMH
jgi:hypothetical protein